MEPDKIEEIIKSIQGGSTIVEKAINDIKQYADSFVRLDDNIGRTSTLITDMNSKVAQLAPTISIATSMIMGASKSFTAFKMEGATAINSVSKQFTDFVNNAKNIGDLGGLSKALNINIDSMPLNKAKEAIKSLASNFFESASSAQEFQTSFLNLLSTSGQFSEVMDKGKLSTEKLNERMAAFNVNLTSVANATGFSRDQVAGFAKELGKIPGALDTNIQFGKDNIRTLNQLDAATKLAAGSGQSLTTVTEVLRNAYDNSNVSGKKSLEFYSHISEASQKLGMRFDDVKQYALEVAGSLKYVGNEGEGSLNVLNRYTEALKATGLGAKASQEIIKGMVSQVGNLTTGTKAFLSARSGGPGGLQGSFQIDKMLRDGKIEEVTKMLESNLKKQLGGRIVSLDDASKSQQGAAQYQKQLSLVQSGAFGGMVKDDAQAKRLLDALASGNVGKASELLDSSKSLENTVSSGSQLQQEQVNILTQINTGIDALTSVSALQAKETIKSFTAAGSGTASKYASMTANIGSDKATQYTGTGKFRNMKEAQADQTQVAIESVGGVIAFVKQLKETIKSDADNTKPKNLNKNIGTRTGSRIPKAKISTMPEIKKDMAPNLGSENFTSAVSDFNKAVEKTTLPRAGSLSKQTEQFSTNVNNQVAHQQHKPNNDGVQKIIVEGLCMDCGEKKINAKIDNALSGIKSSPYNAGNRR